MRVTTGVADIFLTPICVGREFETSGKVPRLCEDVHRWYVETVSSRDGDALILWTSNIQRRTTHSTIEPSNQPQAVAVFTLRLGQGARSWA